MKQYLKFNGTIVAAPAEISFINNKIWSNNAGRSSNCMAVGDIRAIKKTISIKWYHLSPSDVALINSFISNENMPFFEMTCLDENFVERTITVYAGDPSYEIFGWDEKRQFCKGLAVDLIQQ